MISESKHSLLTKKKERKEGGRDKYNNSNGKLSMEKFLIINIIIIEHYFLFQEVNREVNTIGSKVSDIELTKTVVEIKTLLEKIREQIQNLE